MYVFRSKNEVKVAIRYDAPVYFRCTIYCTIRRFCQKPACWKINSALLYILVSCFIANLVLLKHIDNTRMKKQ